jgi:SAM-dependent methyltransferase
MRTPPISRAEIEERISEHLDELLALWWAEQGAAKVRDLELIATVLPFARDQSLRVLDLCCGPGDVGRAIRRQFPKAQIDCIDRDPFLMSVCTGLNRRDNIPGRILTRDLENDDWHSDLLRGYDVVATANALHWFTPERAEALFREIHGLLRDDGVFLFAEPAEAEPPFAAGFERWKAQQPARYSRENWEGFWSRANAILGYDHIKLLGERPTDRIDEDLSVARWIDLLKMAGFSRADVLLRDADEVIVAAMRG